MVSVCYRGGQWRWLSAHDRARGGLVLLEQRGACPGDPDSTFVVFAGVVERDHLAENAAAWVQAGWGGASADERRASIEHGSPPPTAMPVLVAPRDAPVGYGTAHEVLEASVNAAERPFCLFPNPAAAGR